MTDDAAKTPPPEPTSSAPITPSDGAAGAATSSLAEGPPSAPSSSPAGGSVAPPTGTPDDSSKPHDNTVWMVAAVVLAAVVAFVIPWLPVSAEVKTAIVAVLNLGGEVFLHMLKMVVVPLVMVSVMAGILNLGDIRKLGKPGLAVAIFFLSTLSVAVTLGVVMTNLINPGKDFPPELVANARAAMEKRAAQEGANEGTLGPVAHEGAGAEKKAGEASKPAEPNVTLILKNIVLMLFTDSVLKSMAEGNLLPLISFCIVFAGLITTLGAAAQPITDFVLAMNTALMAFIMLVMRVAPIGIFCLVAGRFAQAQLQTEGGILQELNYVFWYFMTVVGGLAIHGLIVLPLCVYFLTKRNPFVFMLQMSDSMLTAFSTASSNATIPVTMECCIQKAGISKKATEFVVPLGATVNMDGTALYEAAAAMFLAQAIGIHLSIEQQFIVGATAALAAIGAAGIPEAGLVTMVIVLSAVGLPKELMAIIIPVDWLLDRFRTVVNVLGDSSGSAFVDQFFEPDEMVLPPGVESVDSAGASVITPVTPSASP